MSSRPRASLVASALLIPLLPLLLAHLVFVPVYRTNDDVGMNMLAAGVGFTSEPTPLLIFSHHWLGHVLNLAYSVLPGVPWYHLYGILALYVAGAVFVWVSLHRKISVTRLLLLVLYFITFGLLFAVSTHFTIASASCAMAASLLWHDRVAHDERFGLPALAVFLALWLASALIRYQSAILIFLLAAPAFAFHGFRMARGASKAAGWNRFAVMVLLPMGGAGLLVAGLSWSHVNRYASDPGWKDYVRTGHSISGLIDYGRGSVEPADRWVLDPHGRPALMDRAYGDSAYSVGEQAAGWSANDYNMMMEWFFADPEVYSEEKLRLVLEGLPGAEFGKLESVRRMRRDHHLVLLLAMTLLPIILVVRSRPAWARCGITLLGVLGVLAYLVFVLDRLPSWVYQPIFAFLCSHAILSTGHEPLLSVSGKVRSWTAIAVLAITLLPLPTTWLILRNGSRNATTVNTALKSALSVIESEPDFLYVVWGSSFPYEWILPSDDMQLFRNMRIYSVGGDTRGAFNAVRLEQLRVRDIYRGIYSHPGIRVISDERLNRLLVRYIEEHYDERVRPRETARFLVGDGRLFSVYRFRTQATGDGPGAPAGQ